jgi:hypothetical protein
MPARFRWHRTIYCGGKRLDGRTCSEPSQASASGYHAKLVRAYSPRLRAITFVALQLDTYRILHIYHVYWLRTFA